VGRPTETGAEREALLRELAEMPAFLAGHLGAVRGAATRLPGSGGAFSPVEHCWHLAELEREGYGSRIERLLTEDEPHLADFDGARLAREREYPTRSLSEGLDAFREARQANLVRLRSLDAAQWSRAGSQEGVGEVRLGDLPRMMVEHDRAHKAEILAWLREVGK